MDLVRTDRLFFDEVSHSYLLDGDKLLIGVTSLMKKHGLGADYSGIPQDVLDNAARVGTDIHREIQDYENGLTVLATPLIDDYRRLGLKFIASEYPVSDLETVASAIDCVYQGSKPNTVILADIKTTAKLHTRALQWQLGIYRTLFERQNPDIKVEALYCIHIDKKSRRLLEYVPIEGVNENLVDDLLRSEREGNLFQDPAKGQNAALVLSDEQLTTYADKAENIARLKAEIRQIETDLKEFDERLLAFMQDNNLEDLAAPHGTFHRTVPYERKTIDADRLRKLYPSIAEKLTKTTPVAARLTYKPNK